MARLEQVGYVFGSCVLRRVFAENKPKMVEIYILNLISMSLTRQICKPEIYAPITHHFFLPGNFER